MTLTSLNYYAEMIAGLLDVGKTMRDAVSHVEALVRLEQTRLAMGEVITHFTNIYECSIVEYIEKLDLDIQHSIHNDIRGVAFDDEEFPMIDREFDIY